MSIVLQSSGGGSVTVNEPSTASNYTQTLPASDGIVMVSGNQPAFFVRKNANQTITSGVETVVSFQTETFDTANCFNPTGSTVGGIPAYSFLPNVAGYYQINMTFQPEGSTALTRYILGIQKNGTLLEVLQDGATINKTTGSYLVYLNGTTDYITYAVYIFASIAVVGSGNTCFSGSLVRAA